MGIPGPSTLRIGFPGTGRAPVSFEPRSIDAPVVLGRPSKAGPVVPDVELVDEAVSRRHAECMFDGSRWHVRSLGKGGTALTAMTAAAAAAAALSLKALQPSSASSAASHALSAVAASGLLRARAAAADKAMRGRFPRYGAEALQRGERPAPERKDMVTVFFSDVVGFTALSAAMEAQQVGRGRGSQGRVVGGWAWGWACRGEGQGWRLACRTAAARSDSWPACWTARRARTDRPAGSRCTSTWRRSAWLGRRSTSPAAASWSINLASVIGCSSMASARSICRTPS